MIETAILFLILAVMLFSSVLVSGWLVKRATFQVIDRFCSYKALNAKKARKVEELGLATPDIFQRLFRPRDYKPYALQALSRAGLIRVTGEGRLYLMEQKLNDDLKCKTG